jgi:hypothetical protein
LLAANGQVNLGRGEAEILDIKIQIHKALHFDGQQIPVPAGILGQLVVRQDVGAYFIPRQMRELANRDFHHSDQLCGFDPSMTGDDRVVICDQNRIAKAKAPDAVGYLPDLFL